MKRPVLLLAALCLVCGCGRFRKPTPADRFGPDEKLHYLILAGLDPAAGRQYLTQASVLDRADFLEWFWQNSESAAERDVYWERAQKARDFFGAIDLLNDDRVKTYIRYGPALRESFYPEPIRTETLTVIVRPAEIWTYRKLGLQFDFVRIGTAYKLVGETKSGPDCIAPSLEQIDRQRPPPQLREELLSLDLEFTLARFEHADDSVETEVHYGIPQRQLAGLVRENELPELFIRMTFTPARGTRTITRDLWVSPGTMPEATDTELAVGREVFRLPADAYAATIEARSAGGSVAAKKTRELDLLDYVRRAQSSSDMVFYSLADSTFQSRQFERGSRRRLVPMVVPTVHSGQTFYALYELYNLGLDEQSRHLVEADYEMIEQATDQLAVVPTPTRIITGPGPKAVVIERLHTMDLRPGQYLLVARARDTGKERDISLTARFRILP